MHQVGRPRSFDEAEVLDLAVDVFWRRGTTMTTTRVLEQELALSQSSIYNAFGTKAELLGLALDRYLERIDAEIVSPLDGADAGLDVLLAFVDDLFEWISDDHRRGCLMLNLLAEQGDNDAVLVERARQYRDRLRLAFRAVLTEVAPQHAAYRSELVLGTVMGLNIAARGGATIAELAALADALRAQIRAWDASTSPFVADA